MDFILKKKKFKFNVDVMLADLSDVPFVNAFLFAKIRLNDGGSFVGMSSRTPVDNHNVVWNKSFQFSCRIASNPTTAVLEPCICRISIRRELKGGKSYEKLGFVDVNLSEFADSGVDGKTKSYILEGYSSGQQRQDNSRLRLNISMALQSADPYFKVPLPKPLRVAGVGHETNFSHGGVVPPSPGSHARCSSTHLPCAEKRLSMSIVGSAIPATVDDRLSVTSASSGFVDEGHANGLRRNKPAHTPLDDVAIFPSSAGASYATDFIPGHFRNTSSASQVSAGYYSDVNKTHSRQSSTESGLAYPGHARKGSDGAAVSLPSKSGERLKKMPPKLAGDPVPEKLLESRVDAEQMIEEIIKGHNLLNAAQENESGAETGLQLFISKEDGRTALGSRCTSGGGNFEPVIIEDSVNNNSINMGH